jgi:hypothetical protein
MKYSAAVTVAFVALSNIAACEEIKLRSSWVVSYVLFRLFYNVLTQT